MQSEVAPEGSQAVSRTTSLKRKDTSVNHKQKAPSLESEDESELVINKRSTSENKPAKTVKKVKKGRYRQLKINRDASEDSNNDVMSSD